MSAHYPKFRVLTLLAMGLLGLLLAAPLRMWGDEVGLVRVGETWRYVKGIKAPSDSPFAWRQINFDDASWSSGLSGFGYGDGATLFLDFGLGNYPAVFLRKKFTVIDPNLVQWLVLRADYEDGFVAYLNGTEIARRGFPAGVEVPYNALATTVHPAGTAEDLVVTAFKALLKPGENVLALQIHTAGSLSFGLFISPELVANFTRGPFLQDASTNRVKIIWHTPVAADSKIEYGADGVLDQTWSDSTLTNIHVAQLTGLLPDTHYHYRVASSSGAATAYSPTYQFRTFREQGGLSFVAVGDTGLGVEDEYRVARVIRNAPVDMVLHLGDVIYPRFTAGRTDLKCFSVYQPDMASRPWFFLYGNHDRYANLYDFAATFYSPTNPVTGGGEFFSFDQGEAHFAALDTDLRVGVDWSVGSPQYRWLEADLAKSTKPWKFLLFHNAIRSSGPHRFDDYNLNHIRDELEFQNSIGQLAQRYGVQVIFNAHEHLYERLNPVGGTHTIVTGGGGGVLYTFGSEWDPADCQFSSQHHCIKVVVEKDFLELEALDMDGHVFDTMHVGRRPPARKTFRSTWHSPTLVFTGTNEGLGNLTGQQFDFAGQPIHTMAGDFSNLGNLYVNHDSKTLFIGLDQAMIYPSNNIFLFIQSPRLTGVSNLVGLGNGIVDPLGQGVDGLDFLENLFFTNFTPCVGAVLGDELGDSQYRAFKRPELSVDIGQGIYYLDSAFTDVPGTQLQQFNQSPQTNAAAHEQNANFIALSIPFSALGGLQPGDTIQIGAVVGGTLFDTNAAIQYRQLDRSFAGISFDGHGFHPARLEGVDVVLAPPAGELQDSDGDGMLDTEEIEAGTDPTDPLSVFRLTLQPDGDSAIRIRWNAVPGKQYLLEYAVGKPSGFQPINPGIGTIIATSSMENIRLKLQPDAGRTRFYRVRLLK